MSLGRGLAEIRATHSTRMAEVMFAPPGGAFPLACWLCGQESPQTLYVSESDGSIRCLRCSTRNDELIPVEDDVEWPSSFASTST